MTLLTALPTATDVEPWIRCASCPFRDNWGRGIAFVAVAGPRLMGVVQRGEPRPNERLAFGDPALKDRAIAFGSAGRRGARHRDGDRRLIHQVAHQSKRTH